MRAGSPVAPREGQTFAGGSRWTRYANFVKLPHTVFALPFALVGAVLASYTHPVSWGEIAWIVVAFTSARFAAMGFNRVVDRHIDARNPRTAMRELPAGTLGVAEAVGAIVVASTVFFMAAWRLNPLCLWLSPVALAWVLWYSYTKRFTRLAHLVLGLGLGIAPVGGYLAITGRWSDPWWFLIALAVAVMTWVGGFDILYALQDYDFDRAHGLHSIPASLGISHSIRVARGLHVVTVLALGAAAAAGPGGLLYGIGVAVVAVLLWYEHRLVREDDLAKMDAAFFTMNGIISLTFFAFVLAGRLLEHTGP